MKIKGKGNWLEEIEIIGGLVRLLGKLEIGCIIETINGLYLDLKIY